MEAQRDMAALIDAQKELFKLDHLVINETYNMKYFTTFMNIRTILQYINLPTANIKIRSGWFGKISEKEKIEKVKYVTTTIERSKNFCKSLNQKCDDFKTKQEKFYIKPKDITTYNLLIFEELKPLVLELIVLETHFVNEKKDGYTYTIENDFNKLKNSIMNEYVEANTVELKRNKDFNYAIINANNSSPKTQVHISDTTIHYNNENKDNKKYKIIAEIFSSCKTREEITEKITKLSTFEKYAIYYILLTKDDLNTININEKIQNIKDILQTNISNSLFQIYPSTPEVTMFHQGLTTTYKTTPENTNAELTEREFRNKLEANYEKDKTLFLVRIIKLYLQLTDRKNINFEEVKTQMKSYYSDDTTLIKVEALYTIINFKDIINVNDINETNLKLHKTYIDYFFREYKYWFMSLNKIDNYFRVPTINYDELQTKYNKDVLFDLLFVIFNFEKYNDRSSLFYCLFSKCKSVYQINRKIEELQIDQVYSVYKMILLYEDAKQYMPSYLSETNLHELQVEYVKKKLDRIDFFPIVKVQYFEDEHTLSDAWGQGGYVY